MHIRKPFKLPGRPNWYVDIGEKRKSLGTADYNEALRKYAVLVEDGGEVKPPAGLYRFVTDFLNWSQSTQSIYTYKSYRTALDKLQNHIGNIPVAEIGSQHIDTLVAAELTDGRARTSVNTMLRHIKAALGKAAEWYGLPRVKVKLLRIEKQPPKVLTRQQAGTVLDQLDGSIRTLVLAYLCTGRRRQELLRLTWDDIDLEGRRYYVRQTKAHLSSWFPINSTFGQLLQSMPRSAGRVFGELHPDTVTHHVKKALVRCGFAGLHLHHLRHSFASIYLESGGDVVALKELLGHQQISTTMIYSHLSLNHLQNEADRVNL